MRNLLAPKESFFTEKQFDRLSNILDNAGQVGFGTVVLGQILSKESINFYIVSIAIMTVIGTWIGSLIVARWGGE